MDANFWLTRWREGQTGFHLPRVTPLLTKYWPSLNLTSSARILVPLCGKSLDMIWLAEQGHSVLGVELAPIAVEQFFAENGLHPTVHVTAQGTHYVADRIEIICGDIFGLERDTLSSCTGVYDRGALVALPAAMRRRYCEFVYGGLAHNYQALVLTVEYDQSAMPGPPFSVDAEEMHALFDARAQLAELARMDVIEKEVKFAERGLKEFVSVSWHIFAGAEK